MRTLKGFGHRFWQLVKREAPAAHAALGNGVASIDYTDRYLLTPLSLALLRELIGAMPGARGAAISIALAPADRSERRPNAVHSAFDDDALRRDVAAALFPNARIALANRKAELPHFRRLGVCSPTVMACPSCWTRVSAAGGLQASSVMISGGLPRRRRGDRRVAGEDRRRNAARLSCHHRNVRWLVARPDPTLNGSSAKTMPDFFADPILNSPYDAPTRHWELDDAGRPTGRIVASRRRAEFVAAVPGQAAERQPDLLDLSDLTDEAALQTAIAEVRAEVDRWRALPNPLDWRVTPETRRLLEHWRDPDPDGLRPFFCQVEAVETAIWLTEVAPQARQARHGASSTSSRDANERRQPRPLPPRDEDGDRRRQDDRHGHADRLAGGQRRPPARAASASPAPS